MRQSTQNTANPLVYNNMGWLGDSSHRGQGCQAWTAVGLIHFEQLLSWSAILGSNTAEQASHVVFVRSVGFVTGNKIVDRIDWIKVSDIFSFVHWLVASFFSSIFSTSPVISNHRKA